MKVDIVYYGTFHCMTITDRQTYMSFVKWKHLSNCYDTIVAMIVWCLDLNLHTYVYTITANHY